MSLTDGTYSEAKARVDNNSGVYLYIPFEDVPLLRILLGKSYLLPRDIKELRERGQLERLNRLRCLLCEFFDLGTASNEQLPQSLRQEAAIG